MYCATCMRNKADREFISTKSGGLQRTCRACRKNPPDPAKALLRRQKAGVITFNAVSKYRGWPHTVTLEHVQFCYEFWDCRCAICFREGDLQLDHWIAVRDSNCPGSTPDNMMLLCRSCNIEKENLNPYEWLRWKIGDKAAEFFFTRIEQYFSEIGKIQPQEPSYS